MVSIDELAYGSPFMDWSPLGKLLLALSLLVSSLVASSIIVPLLGFVIGLILLSYSTHLRFPQVIALSLMEGLLVFFLGAVVIALVTAGTPLFTIDLGFVALVFSREGVELATLVFLRALVGVVVMLFFATSTPLPQFANALEQIRAPKELVELTVLIYRYSLLLLQQIGTMYLAAESRLGFKGYGNKLRTTAKLAVGIFIRSLDLAERSQIALDCRGYGGRFHSYRPPTKLSVKWVALSAMVLIAMRSMDILASDPVGLTAMLCW